MTSHQCWNVCEWETTEGDQQSEAPLSLPIYTQQRSRKPTFPLWPSRLRKEVHILFSTFKAIHTNKVAQRKGRDTQRVTSSQWFLQFCIAIRSTSWERPRRNSGKKLKTPVTKHVSPYLGCSHISPFILEHIKYQIRKMPQHRDSKTSNFNRWMSQTFTQSISSNSENPRREIPEQMLIENPMGTHHTAWCLSRGTRTN